MAREKPNIVAYSLYLLGRRGRTKYELRSKLIEKKYERPEIENAISELERMGLLDDKKFAELYSRDKVSIYRRGKFRIALELLRKGVQRDFIDEALETVEEGDELEAARSLAKSRIKNWLNLEELKRKHRLLSLLQRRGFSPTIIRKVMNEVEGRD